MSVGLCSSFVRMCLWAMLWASQGTEGYRIRPYPYRFPRMSMQWQSYASDFQLRSDGDSRRIVNAGMITFQAVSQQATTCQGNCRKDNVSILIEKAARKEKWMRKRSRNLYSDPAPVCSNSTFCVHATHYPEELVNRAIRQNDGLRLLQSVDSSSSEVGKLDDSPFCSSYARLIYPRSAETINRRWIYVVNQDNLRQGVRIERCAKEGSVCGDLDHHLPDGYKAFCKQKYVYRELVAIDGGIVKKDTFRFPSSCCCYRELDRSV